jgi:glutamate N-acetyltransferase/amino-acid N-acetyltransferase
MKKHLTTVTALNGVYASGISAGIKANGKRDLAYIFVPNAFGSAGVFTKSAFAAPPLKVTQEALGLGTLKAIIVNSGNANAGTGKTGYRDAKATAKSAAKLLGIKPNQVGVASTGIIGCPLPMPVITTGLQKLLKDPLQKNGRAAAEAIMTTDLTRKEIVCQGKVGGKTITIAGFAKGSGMIAPNMATMLGFLVTDAKINSAKLSQALKLATEATFNMTSVDTDTSTNDMVVAFATGETGDAITTKKHQQEFLKLLTSACSKMTRLIAADGEGATKLIEVTVQGARNVRDARVIAKNIVNSPLVKTAIHGSDPNWGRVLAAAGKDPSAKVNPERVDLTFAGAPVMRRGKIVPHNRDKIRKLLSTKEVRIQINVGAGTATATAWGCDLTHGYVDINVSYN